MVWQDLIKTDSSPSSGEWDEPFLRGPLTPWTSSAEGLAFSEESSSPITRPISFGEQLPVTAASGKRLLSSSRYREAIRVATTTDNDDSDEEHRW